MSPQSSSAPQSVEDRTARGRAARSAVPRRSHGSWAPPPDRGDPIALLEEQATTRVPELLPIRYGRMLVSPFTFYRGAALIMAADLATGPRSELTAQLCGDAHLSNFGVFGSPERRLVFDINDFDETHPGPWEWDVKRLAASLEIAGRDRGFTAAQRSAVVAAGMAQYREAMRTAAGMRNMEIWYSHFAVDELIENYRGELGRGAKAKRAVKTAERTLAKSRTRDSMQAFTKLTHVVDGQRRIVADPPLITPVEDLAGQEMDRLGLETGIRDLLRAYRRTLETDRKHLLEGFRYVHMARKVVGVGSVGTRAWIILLLGRDDQDPLLLQAKEAQVSVLERFTAPSRYRNQGQRVVAGQRLMQATSDIFLGWQRVLGIDGVERDFYIRQLRDWKGSAEVDTMTAAGMRIYARLCAASLARAHARSGDRVAIAAYLGTGDVFDQAIVKFATAYADQNERDYAALVAAVKSGRLAAETGL